MEKNQLWRTGLLIGALYIALILLTAFVPFLSIITLFILPVPVMFFVYKADRLPMLVYIVITSLLALVIGGIGILPVVIITMATGSVLGVSLKQKRTFMMTLTAVSTTFLVSLVMSYALLSLVTTTNIFQEIIRTVDQSVAESMETFDTVDEETRELLQEQVNQIPDVIATLIPSIFAIISAIVGLLIVLVAFAIGRKRHLPVPRAPKLATVTLPRSIIWYYLVTLLLVLFGPVESDTFFETALVNVQFMLRALLFVQGITFLFFLAAWKKWPKVVPVLLTIFTIIFFPFVQIVTFIGIIDLGLQLRRRLLSKKM